MNKEKIKAISIVVWMIFLTAFYCFSPDYSCKIDIWAKGSYVLINLLLLVFAFTSYPNAIIKSFRAWQISVTLYNLLLIIIPNSIFWEICNNKIVSLFLCTVTILIFIIEWIKLIRK
jgi:hypothetical protein